MELYYKDLISKEASLDRLVDHLSLVVQGAEEFVEAVGPTVDLEKKEEIVGRLARLKERCWQIKEGAVDGARATDRLVHRHPYSAIGIAFVAGLVACAIFRRRR